MKAPQKTPDSSSAITQALIAECKRRLIEEGVLRINTCLAQLSETEVWQRPNANCNSVGNLILHLCGNVRQWILTGLGEQTDTRERDREFELESAVSKEVLIQQLDDLMEAVVPCLEGISAEELLEKRSIQGFQESKLSILIHVVEHFSYHVGQISYIVKARKDMDLAYYANMDLNSTK